MIKKTKKNLDRPVEPIQRPDEPIQVVAAAAARKTLAPPVQGCRGRSPWIYSNPPSQIWLVAAPSPDLKREKEEH